MTTVCSGPRFESLVNPYTGERIATVMSVAGGRIRFRAPDTYSTSDYFPTAEDAYRHYNRVNGTEGLRSGKPIVCAYTGRPLTLEHDEYGYRYSGGFNPKLFYTRDEWMYYASMRGGSTRYPMPGGDPSPRVTRPVRPVITASARRHAEEMRTELTDDAVKLAEKTMAELRDKGLVTKGSSTVSMSVPKGKGSGK